jgi:hypothetical protein
MKQSERGSYIPLLLGPYLFIQPMKASKVVVMYTVISGGTVSLWTGSKAVTWEYRTCTVQSRIGNMQHASREFLNRTTVVVMEMANEVHSFQG